MEADVTEWCHNNNMALNVNKKNSFSTPVHPDRFSTLIITNGATAETVNCLGLLGLQIWNCPSPDPKHQKTFMKIQHLQFLECFKNIISNSGGSSVWYHCDKKVSVGECYAYCIIALLLLKLNNYITIFLETNICCYFFFSSPTVDWGSFPFKLAALCLACRCFVN